MFFDLGMWHYVFATRVVAVALMAVMMMGIAAYAGYVDIDVVDVHAASAEYHAEFVDVCCGQDDDAGDFHVEIAPFRFCYFIDIAYGGDRWCFCP